MLMLKSKPVGIELERAESGLGGCCWYQSCAGIFYYLTVENKEYYTNVAYSLPYSCKLQLSAATQGYCLVPLSLAVQCSGGAGSCRDPGRELVKLSVVGLRCCSAAVSHGQGFIASSRSEELPFE